MRDGRNPYGAMGGYVRDRYSRDFAEDMRRGGRDYADMRRGGRDYYGDMRYDYEEDMYPFEVRGRIGDRYSRMDYHKSKMLSDDELKMWSRRLMEEIDDKHKQMLKMETIITKAEEMGIKFDKFTPFEMYVTVLMMFTDFYEAIRTSNVDMYIKLAKYWLCDEDAALQYGEKLAAYYNHIVNEF